MRGDFAAGAGDKAQELALKQRARVRGFACDCCGQEDSFADPVQPETNRLWARYGKLCRKEMARLCLTVMTLITAGCHCWWCVRVWQSKYMVQCMIAEFKDWMAAGNANHDEFMMYLHWLIVQVQKKGEVTHSRNVRLVWPTPWELHQLEIYRVRWIKPASDYLEIANYKTLHGDPLTDGRGDTIEAGPGGVQLVKFQITTTWQTKRQEIYIYIYIY